MADNGNGLLSTILIGSGLFLIGRWSNSLATDVERAELADHANNLDGIAGRIGGITEDERHRDEIGVLREDLREFEKRQEPSVRKVAKKVARKTSHATDKVGDWAKAAYKGTVGRLKRTKSGKSTKSDNDDSDGNKSDDDKVQAKVVEEGDEVTITIPKEEWDRLNADEKGGDKN